MYEEEHKTISRENDITELDGYNKIHNFTLDHIEKTFAKVREGLS